MSSLHLSSNTILDNNLIFVRSKDGIFVNQNIHTDFSIVLKKSITKNEDELFKVILQSAQIPYTFRNTNENNNYIDYKENGVLKTPIQINSGNYNILELITEIQTQLNNNTSFASDNYTLTYNQIENKVNISSLSTQNTEFLFNSGVNVLKSINKQLGYTNDNNITINNLSSSISDSFVDLIRIHSLFIRSNLSSNSSIDSESLTNTDILVNIPINSNPLSMIQYQYYEGMSYNLIDNDKITQISIRLTDQNGNLIDLGKQINFEFLLNIQTIKNPLFVNNNITNEEQLNNETINNVQLRKINNPLNEEIDLEEIKKKSKEILSHTEKHKQNLINIKSEIENI
jgi:hypothetical protein